MLDEKEKKEITEFVMSDIENRLELALEIYASYDLIRAAVIKHFVQRLVNRLNRDLPPHNWEITARALLDEPLKKHNPIVISKSSWPKGIHVASSGDLDGPRDWWMGIVTPIGHKLFKPIHSHLSDAIGPGRTDENGYPWWVCLDGKWKDWPLSDWRAPTTVLMLGKDAADGEYGNYLVSRLVRIALELDSFVSSEVTQNEGS
jgi:hypothetical protein